jgi:DUF1365 family protein
MRHALYEGVVRHRRHEPVRHCFAERIALPLLDLSDLDSAVRAMRGLPLDFRRVDYHGEEGVPLDEAVRRTVEERTGQRPAGHVMMLAHLRSLGWCFNPVAVYYCHDAIGQLVAQVLEVTNTPWAERTTYVVDLRGVGGDAWEHWFPKALHVSPFMAMDVAYRLRSSRPRRHLTVELVSEMSGRRVFDADMRLARRRPFDRPAALRLLLRYPLMPHRVSAGIHLHALRLWAKGAPVVAHPGRAQ